MTSETSSTSSDLTYTLPASWYASPEIHAAERRAVFGGTWLYACAEAEIPELGDYVTLTLAGYSIFVIREAEGIRAFHNVCRHRASPLLWDERGRLGNKLIRCQ